MIYAFNSALLVLKNVCLEKVYEYLVDIILEIKLRKQIKYVSTLSTYSYE